ncbi:MAG: hypothetical protein NTW26_01730 [bacterium]|nr:hypothetical protein [bacterium]
MRTALRILLILGLLLAASCKIGRRPMGAAFVLREGDTSRAFYMPVLGDEGLRFGEPVALPFTGPVDQLVFTPDGRELWAWAGAEAGEPALWSLAFSGDRFGEPERRFDLSSYPAGLSSAAAPLDGSVVFDAQEPVTGRWQLFIYDDGGLRQLTPGDADYQSPTLSPDGSPNGSVIVFSSNRDGAGGAKADWGIWGCEIATGSLFAVYDSPSDEGSPWFAPDGALYFDSFEYSGEVPVGSVWRIDEPWERKGSPTAERLAGIEGLVLFPRPSPDGEWLLVTVYSDPRWMSRVVNLETMESRPLAGEDTEITYACWR